MNRVSHRMAKTAVTSGLALVWALGGGTAEADDYYWFRWCPGQVNPAFSSDRVVDWDWTVCHKYRYEGNTAIDDTGRVYPAPARPPGSICGTDLFTGTPIPC